MQRGQVLLLLTIKKKERKKGGGDEGTRNVRIRRKKASSVFSWTGLCGGTSDATKKKIST